MGPCIVLAEDLDASDLKISLWLNGDKKQDSRTSKMIFDIPAIIGGSYFILPTMIIKIAMVITIWPFDNRIHYSSHFLCSPYSSYSSYSSDSSYLLASLLSPLLPLPLLFLTASLSEGFTLNPGDIILTGTPDGVGFAAKPPRTLLPGDHVRIEIESIGTLENDVKV